MERRGHGDAVGQRDNGRDVGLRGIVPARPESRWFGRRATPDVDHRHRSSSLKWALCECGTTRGYGEAAGKQTGQVQDEGHLQGHVGENGVRPICLTSPIGVYYGI